MCCPSNVSFLVVLGVTSGVDSFKELDLAVGQPTLTGKVRRSCGTADCKSVAGGVQCISSCGAAACDGTAGPGCRGAHTDGRREPCAASLSSIS